jgi:outer membrane protein OmpA-like peptidoglycan-associated protein
MKNIYNHALLVIICLAGTVQISLAQDFLPTLNDNYMGINQVLLQPASIVDSRFKVDINVSGVNSDIYNDYVHINFQETFKSTDGSWMQNIDYIDNPNGKDKNAYMGQTYLGPGFLINLGDKDAIGFTTRIRQIMNLDDISEPLARSYVKQFEFSEYWNQWYKDDVFRIVDHVFQDYGLSYAREVFNSGENYLKTGITVKLLQGLGATSLQPEEFYYYFYAKSGNSDDKADYVSMNSDITYSGLSDNWNWGSNLNDNFHTGFTYQFVAKPSVGLDLGLVYEFRPKYLNYRYNMDGQKDLERKDKNKYLLKVGVSILDIGRLRYQKHYNSQDFSANFTPDYIDRYNSQNNNIPTNTHWMEIEGSDFGFPPFVNFSDTVYQRMIEDRGIEPVAGNEEKFTVRLPTALSLQVDVNIVKGLYVNLTTFTALHQGFSKTGNSHYMSNYSITPRYEHKWFSVMLPIYYNQYQKINLGLGLRLAFIYIGANNLFKSVFSDTYGVNFYLGVKVPIWQEKPPKDTDNDGVSDEKDLCPATPGTWELMGCPDTDGDGVADSQDDCPNVAGPKEFNGCPDRDGDGVPDKDDLCPDTPGPKLSQGCPDRDGDGVVDNQDECPDVPGPAQLNGCPDRDGDGVPDYKDKCPDIAGLPEYGGCPFLDTDGDGIKDQDDMCPEIPGPPENNGCPYTDSDGDGVIDKEDRCPLTPGDPANFGCPVIKVEEVAVLKTAFENLEFETGKAIIRSTSFASLDELAALLISKPLWKLKISGHTDNVGNDASNMTLSKNRAQSVGKYLQGKGVSTNQLITEWFGETRPIADNDTPQGRQQNRRVEMQVVFD